MSTNRLETITALAAQLAAPLGLELWGVELSGSGRPVLRVYVERQPQMGMAEQADTPPEGGTGVAEDGTGVSVDQCAHLSRLMALSLDVDDPFAAAWTLEVSSPGLERQFFRLDQMRPYVGREMDLSLLDGHPDWPAIGGASLRKKFRGALETVSDTAFTLYVAEDTRKEGDPERVDVAWENVRRVSLVHTFPEPGLPAKSKSAKHAVHASEQEAALDEEGVTRTSAKAKKQRPASGGKA